MTRHLTHSILLAATLAAMPQLAAARDSTPEVDALGVGGWLQQHKFAATDVTSDSLGVSVAVAGDTALVGAPLATTGGNDFAGAAFVFVRSGDTWIPQGRLIALDPEGSAQFGFAVALSEDGDTALVGAPFDDAEDNVNQGAVYVFSRGVDGWSQRRKFTASDGAATFQFGVSVALSGDTALVGANFADVEGTPQGAAYVFTRGADGWQQQDKLFAGDGAADDQFGASVALAGDIALVGASSADLDGKADQGAAYAFVRDGEEWSQQAKLVGEEETVFHRFGTSVALAGDGNTALVGAPNTNVGQGAAFVFTRDGGGWSPQATLFALSGGTADEFGNSVTLAGDGNTALIGAPGTPGNGTGNVWTRAGQEWTPRAELTANDGVEGDGLGFSIALSGDTAVVGAPFADIDSQDQGAAYVFLPRLSPAALDVDLTPVDSDGNGVFEPGETVEMAPGWRNNGGGNAFADGILSHFTGPAGASYDVAVNGSAYGPIPPGEIGSCRDTDTCPQLEIQITGPDRPASHWDATVAEQLQAGPNVTFARTWTLHLGESFSDVPPANLFYSPIETLLHSGVTGGCTETEYCPADANSRSQMPVFVLRALEGVDYTPPPCDEGEEEFDDVPSDHLFCPWIEELARRDVISGCGGGDYCPAAEVTRAQMAIFLLKTLLGGDYTPPECTGVFTDVDCPSLFADWIEDLAAREITGGCSENAYCPGDPVSRAQMAVFVGKTFGLTLYGP